MKKRTDFQKFKMNGQFENQSSRLMKTIEEGSIVDDDSITAYPKLSKLPKKVESNRKLDFFTNSLIQQTTDLLFTYQKSSRYWFTNSIFHQLHTKFISF